MSDNLIARLIPHQGCVITPKGDAVEIASAARDWVMAAAVAPLICRAPFVFRVVGRTDSTNLRMHWHSGARSAFTTRSGTSTTLPTAVHSDPGRARLAVATRRCRSC